MFDGRSQQNRPDTESALLISLRHYSMEFPKESHFRDLLLSMTIPPIKQAKQHRVLIITNSAWRPSSSWKLNARHSFRTEMAQLPNTAAGTNRKMTIRAREDRLDLSDKAAPHAGQNWRSGATSRWQFGQRRGGKLSL